MFSTLSCEKSILLRHCFSQKSKPLIRSINLLGRGSKPVLLNKSHHRLIYHFPYINLVGAFMRTKIWVPAVTIPISPFVYFLVENKLSTFILLASAGIYYAFGRFSSKITKNTVGKMYVNKEGAITDVIISSVDASGRRIDRIHPLNDIINCDFPSVSARYMGFIQLGIEKSDVYYNLNISNCNISDQMAFDCVLGGIFGPVYPKEVNQLNTNEDPKKQLQDCGLRNIGNLSWTFRVSKFQCQLVLRNIVLGKMLKCDTQKKYFTTSNKIMLQIIKKVFSKLKKQGH